MASKFFGGMLTDGPKPSEPIDLSVVQNPTMAQALALLRFMYERETLTEENIHHLVRNDHLPGVLRLAHKFDCVNVFEKCKRMTNDLLLLGPPRRGHCVEAASNAPLVKSDLVKDIRDIALNIKDHVLQEACYTYVSKWCYQTTSYNGSGGFEPSSFQDTAGLVRELGEYPDLLRAALFTAMHRNMKLTGKMIRRTFEVEDDHPSALFTFKFQIIDENLRYIQHHVAVVPRKLHDEFHWNNFTFRPYISLGITGFKIHMRIDMPANEAGP